MITAVIQHKNDTLVVELPKSNTDLQIKLLSIGVRTLPQNIKLFGGEDAEVDVQLASGSRVGQHLCRLFNTKNSLGDVNTKVRAWSDSNYNYTETSFYAISRGGKIGFERVPVDGSTKMDDALMESIEPYDFTGAVDFQTAYLAGFLADKYDVDSEQSIERANERIKKSTENAFASTVQGYSTVIPESTSIRLQNGKAKYALYPVWLLNTTWNGQRYTFAMNGQTGKFVGDLPLDKGAYKKWLFGLTSLIGAAVFAVSYLLWLL